MGVLTLRARGERGANLGCHCLSCLLSILYGFIGTLPESAERLAYGLTVDVANEVDTATSKSRDLGSDRGYKVPGDYGWVDWAANESMLEMYFLRVSAQR